MSAPNIDQDSEKPELYTSPTLTPEQSKSPPLNPNAGICYINGQAYSEGSYVCRGYGGIGRLKVVCRNGAWVETGEFC